MNCMQLLCTLDFHQHAAITLVSFGHHQEYGINLTMRGYMLVHDNLSSDVAF